MAREWDRDPFEAIKALIRRWAYVLVPLSVVLIKYFPGLGRSYDRWTGVAYYSGVGYDKNMLGYLCLVCGSFFVWDLVTLWRHRDVSWEKKGLLLGVLFLAMIGWLLYKARSASAVGALAGGCCLLATLGLRFVKRRERSVDFYVIIGIITVLLFFAFFDVLGIAVETMNREETLTGRTMLWKKLLDMGTDPIIGVGYESFWLGNRAKELWEEHWWRPNQAHNGYLEVYLNLGAIGLCLLAGIVVSAYRKSRKTLVDKFDSGRFRMTFLGVTLMYAITEAPFVGLHPIWLIFLLIALEWPRPSQLGPKVRTHLKGYKNP